MIYKIAKVIIDNNPLFKNMSKEVKQQYIKENAKTDSFNIQTITLEDLSKYYFLDRIYLTELNKYLFKLRADHLKVSIEDMRELLEDVVNPGFKKEFFGLISNMHLEYLVNNSKFTKNLWRTSLTRAAQVNIHFKDNHVVYNNNIYFVFSYEELEALIALKNNFPDEYRLIYSLSILESLEFAKKNKLLNKIEGFSKLTRRQKLNIIESVNATQVSKFFYVFRTSTDRAKDMIQDVLEGES